MINRRIRWNNKEKINDDKEMKTIKKWKKEEIYKRWCRIGNITRGRRRIRSKSKA